MLDFIIFPLYQSLFMIARNVLLDKFISIEKAGSYQPIVFDQFLNRENIHVQCK